MRGALHWDSVLDLLENYNIDICCLQECGDLTGHIDNRTITEVHYPFTYPRMGIESKFGTESRGSITTDTGINYGVYYFNSWQSLGYQNSMMILVKGTTITDLNSFILFPSFSALRPLIGVNIENLTFLNVHLPSGNKYAAGASFNSQLEQLLVDYGGQFLIAGDWNCDPTDIHFCKDWDPSVLKRDFSKQPTHGDNILDYVIRRTDNGSVKIFVGDERGSDHKFVVFKYSNL